MKFSYHHSMCPVEQYVPLTQEAEKLGFTGITMPESICYPKEATSQYPYNDDGSREFLESVPFMDPFILSAHLAAATETIEFTTSVYKLAIRQPVLAAKQLTSLAILSNNRFNFGVGISPWEEDFDIAQIPFAKRGKRMNEMIDIVRGLMTEEYFGYEGEIFQIPEVKFCPAPTKAVPILVGGHSEAALKRAVLRGDGWIAAGADYEGLKKMIGRLDELRKEYGKEDKPFAISVAGPDAYSPDGIKRLRDLGVTEVTVAFRNIYQQEPDDKTLDEKKGMLNWYANEVIAKSGV